MGKLFPKTVFLGNNFKCLFKDDEKSPITSEMYLVGCGVLSLVMDYNNGVSYNLHSLKMETLMDILNIIFDLEDKDV
jgi:hypothetical protein